MEVGQKRGKRGVNVGLNGVLDGFSWGQDGVWKRFSSVFWGVTMGSGCAKSNKHGLFICAAACGSVRESMRQYAGEYAAVCGRVCGSVRESMRQCAGECAGVCGRVRESVREWAKGVGRCGGGCCSHAGRAPARGFRLCRAPPGAIAGCCWPGRNVRHDLALATQDHLGNNIELQIVAGAFRVASRA